MYSKGSYHLLDRILIPGGRAMDMLFSYKVCFEDADLVHEISGRGPSEAYSTYKVCRSKSHLVHRVGWEDRMAHPIYRRSVSGEITLESIAAPEGVVFTSASGMTWTPYTLVTDRLGSVRAIVDMSSGTVVERNDYYPYGKRITSPSSAAGSYPQLAANRWRFSGKEEQDSLAFTPYLDFGARQYDPEVATWLAPDPLATDYPGLSPYVYCAGDPVNLVDPEGREIMGASRKDAQGVVDDLRSMFQGEKFANFRSLIVQNGRKHNGRSLKRISHDALQSAFTGVELSEDQKALIEIVVNTINSKDKHVIEYTYGEGIASPQAEAAFLPGFLSGTLGPFMNDIMQANKGLPLSLLSNEGGGGITTPTKSGSYTIVFANGHANGRSVTTGHEILGHGRSIALGLYEPDNPNDYQQHLNAIQTENLILRVMGIPFVNDGHNHGPRRVIPNPQDLPSFR